MAREGCEAGKKYNPESATDLRSRRFSFDACGVTFSYTLEVPEYVLARLDSAAMDALHSHMQRYAMGVVSDAIKGGYYHSTAGENRMRADVGQQLKNYIWNEFSKSQERAGQDCWEVAASLQGVLA